MSEPTPLEAIFFAALEKPAAERGSYLAEACGGDADLRRRVERMLTAQMDAASFLETPPSAIVREAVPTLDQAPLEKPGTQIGPYKLLQQIGEGGMGVVYMAEQHEPVKRRVALKIIKPGMDTRQVIARFEAERQALSLMDHPNIAKVLDAGTTESGRPYFVMELVKGQPITLYCDEKQLTPRQRLELLLPVCQAIQHAHQKGIIHRDIKPTNILVAEYDQQPVPKVIDFGVAKAIGSSLTEKTMFTGLGQIVGTLEYMSPEQAKVNQLDIDTRSDIYSLGVLLYELLTGSTPFDRQRLRSAAFDEMLRIIREEEPPKPSTKLSESKDSLPSISAQRHTEPAKLTKLVRGELDWIVMKALEKDRKRRYETANGFAADVQRYLADEQVLACPPSMRYRLRKFAGRNRAAVMTISLIVMILIGAVSISTWQAFRATRAEHDADIRRAEAETNHQRARQAIEEYFTLVSESKLLDIPGLQPLRKSLLDSALRYYQEMLTQRDTDPQALADIALAYLRVANICCEVDRNDDAVAALEAALDAVDRLRREHPQAREQQLRLAGYWKVSRPASLSTRFPKDFLAAERTLSRFLEVWETLAAENPQVEGFQSDLAYINALVGDFQGSRAFIRDRAAFPRAVDFMSKAAGIWDRLSQEHPNEPTYVENLAAAHNQLIWLFRQTGQQREAEAALDRAHSLYERLANQHPNVPAYREGLARSLHHVGKRLERAGRNDEAIAMHRRAFEMLMDLAMQFPMTRSHSDMMMQNINALRGLSPDTQTELIGILNKVIEKRPDNADLLQARGRTYLAAHQSQLALADLTRALELAPNDPNAPWWRMDRANALTTLQRYQEAETELTKATQLWPDIFDPWIWRGHFYLERQQWDKAIADFSKSLQLNPGWADTWHFRGLGFANLKQWDKAIHDQTKAIERDGKKWAYWHQRGLAHLNMQQWAEAAADYTQAIELNPGDATLHHDLARLLVTCPDSNVLNPSRAVQAARQATSLSPKDGQFWNTLGAAHYRAGDWRAATEALGKSIELRNGGDAFDWFLLAMAHWNLGSKDEARKWYDQAITWMEANAKDNAELIRFRVEAVELMKKE